MLSPFGKALRKLRIDRGWRLKDMADGIDVSASYLSAVETGRKSISSDLVSKIEKWAKLTADECSDLARSAAISAKEFKFALPKNATDADREAVAFLARTFEEGDREVLKQVRELVERRRA